jgi:hypothetical protein
LRLLSVTIAQIWEITFVAKQEASRYVPVTVHLPEGFVQRTTMAEFSRRMILPTGLNRHILHIIPIIVAGINHNGAKLANAA